MARGTKATILYFLFIYIYPLQGIFQPPHATACHTHFQENFEEELYQPIEKDNSTYGDFL
jgi:hypothetical protein